jgi:hypothetical protein
MKRIFSIALIVFAGCKAPELSELRNDELAITSILSTENEVVSVQLFSLSQDGKSTLPVSDAVVQIHDDSGVDVPLTFIGTRYEAGADFTIIPERTYTVRAISGDNRILEGVAEIPPAIALSSIDLTTISIGSGGDVATGLSWTSLNSGKYSYILQLECLEENPQIIPQENYGQFTTRFGLPQLNAQATISKSDFTYYGQHRLTVFAMDRELDAIYFYSASDIRGILAAGPDNVSGGKGFVAGVSTFSIDLNVVP